MSDTDHLLFSLKHDGVSLPILCELFEIRKRADVEHEIARAVGTTPTGQYHRRLWYLYEWLTGRRLNLPAPSTSGFIRLLDPLEHVTGAETRHSRQRVIDNLPGNRAFCPLVRRSTALAARSSAEVRDRIATIVETYDPDLLARAISFIYTKETRSSFAIEREVPTASRAEKFASVLAGASELRNLSEAALTGIQNRIVDPRFAEDGFRSLQNYVGESLGLHRQVVHYVPPRPSDLGPLMDGWQRAVAEHSGKVSDAVAWAATISFGFVFLHPFEDGNGRLHRYLIHHILGREGVTSKGVIVPVSAVMLARPTEYDRGLEAFSRPLMELVDFELDERGYMAVTNDTARYYRYFDATPMAEALYTWLDEAIDRELRDELRFLAGLGRARAAMQEIVDLPDRLAELFVKLVVANGGRLAKKRRGQFSMLTNDELTALEAAVRAHLHYEGASGPRQQSR
jgi:hypothetical protein